MGRNHSQYIHPTKASILNGERASVTDVDRQMPHQITYKNGQDSLSSFLPALGSPPGEDPQERKETQVLERRAGGQLHHSPT